MSNDFLSSNKSFKGILKNPDPKSSLAATSSILRKDPTKVHSEGIGLNPNFNIEDEYIQNLQKQIHFMDLEIKLLKEKQEQDEALGGNYNFQKIGLKDGKLISDHIVTASSKYKDMRKNLKGQELIIEEQFTKAKEETAVHKSKVDYVKKNFTELEERVHHANLEMAKDLNEAKTKLLQERKQREDLEHEIERIKKQLDNFRALNANLKRDQKIMDVDDYLQKSKFDADEAVDKAEEKDKDETIHHLKEDKIKYLATIEKDAKFHALLEENADYRKRALINEKELNQATYKVLEFETLQELSIRKKEEEIEQRKKLQVELEKWQDQLQDTIKNNELKVEKKLRESESQELKRRQGEMLKEDRELADLKSKLFALEVEARKHTVEREHRIMYLHNLTEKNQKKQEQAEIYHKEIENLDPKMNELLGHVELLELKLNEKREEKERVVEKLRHVEEENIALQTSYHYLSSTIHIDEDMKNINLEELRSLIQNNEMVNESINEFMQKWDFLKRFAKRG